MMRLEPFRTKSYVLCKLYGWFLMMSSLTEVENIGRRPILGNSFVVSNSKLAIVRSDFEFLTEVLV